MICGALAARGTHLPDVVAAGSLEWPELSLPDLRIPELPDVRARLRDERFRLRSVDFLGLVSLQPVALLPMVLAEEPPALIDVDPSAICEELARHPRIADCWAARVPPDRLVIEIDERVPLAVAEDGGHGLDAHGAEFPLDAAEARELPRVAGDREPALRLVAEARRQQIALARVEAGDGELRFTPAGRDVVVRGRGSVAELLARWRRLEESGLAADKGAHEIDLRFSGRAVLRGFRDQEGGEEDGSS
jgi:hypothetical protein